MKGYDHKLEVKASWCCSSSHNVVLVSHSKMSLIDNGDKECVEERQG